MRKLCITLLAVAVAVMLVPGVASAVPGDGIASSAHDFTITGGTSPFNFAGSLCETCHTPHSPLTSEKPLWNHSTPAQTYTLYTNPATMDSTTAQPQAPSKLCLSCHDGQTAVDTYGANVGTTKIPGGDNHNLTLDLSDDHPISLSYTTAATDDNEIVADNGDGTVGTSSLPLFGAGSDQLECATCHDAHNSAEVVSDPLLRHAVATICTQCHDK